MKSIPVLYISYDGMTDNLGQSQVLPYIQGLSKEGFSFSLLSFEKPERFKETGNVIQEICDQSGIDWHPMIYRSKPPVLSSFMDIRDMFREARKIQKERSIKIVHCRSYMAALVGLSLKRKFDTCFLFDMRGFWADERFEGNIWSRRNPVYRFIYRFFKKKERAFFAEADYTISLTEMGKGIIHNFDYLKQQPIPVEVIPCCSDLDHFKHPGKDHPEVLKRKNELGIKEGQMIVTYLGSIGTWYMMPEMLRFFTRLKIRHPDARFLFLTPDDPEWIEREAAKERISKDELIILRSPRKELPYYMALSTFSIFLIKPLMSKKASSPTKQGEIMSLGIPLVCNDGVGDTGAIVRDTGAGLVVDDFSDRAYDAVVEKVDELLDIPADKIRLGADKYYSLQKGIARYKYVYFEILKTRKK